MPSTRHAGRPRMAIRAYGLETARASGYRGVTLSLGRTTGPISAQRRPTIVRLTHPELAEVLRQIPRQQLAKAPNAPELVRAMVVLVDYLSTQPPRTSR
jgi:hypothetical protein